jgi:hypothetical protein
MQEVLAAKDDNVFTKGWKQKIRIVSGYAVKPGAREGESL